MIWKKDSGKVYKIETKVTGHSLAKLEVTKNQIAATSGLSSSLIVLFFCPSRLKKTIPRNFIWHKKLFYKRKKAMRGKLPTENIPSRSKFSLWALSIYNRKSTQLNFFVCCLN